ncbi:MAG: peptidyl-tRNA hydrolase Pth2 [Nitrososphaerota archaeon]|nr:peptidyl-tRNA hydrolase Pth2 [Candidatus Calditenuaceae archaeon]MDW8074079.1 peptidyl-tRNA hydrolase Pth2 [Nitrososphaerota archaeon]
MKRNSGESEEEFKQVIVVRRDLKLGRGKIAAQAAHASLTAYLETARARPGWASKWLASGQKKVVVAAPSLEELLSVRLRAEEEGIPAALIEDAGLTQVEPGTPTALAIGPAPTSLIDKITRHLKLL